MTFLMRAAMAVIGACATTAAVAAEPTFSTVAGHGGVPLVVAEAGNRQGPPILFIHGYSQSYLSWEKQLGDADLARDFHLIALDLRGHGGSAKPTQPEDYSSEAWAGDIAAVIAATTAKKPVLVPWSMGGTVTFAYVKHKGVAGIAGVNFVAAATLLGDPPTQSAAEIERGKAFSSQLMGMLSPDMALNIAATRWFVGALTKNPLPAPEQERIVAYNMTTPAYVRQAMFARGPIDFRDQAARMTVPALFSHGDQDDVVAYQLSVDNARRLPNATLSNYAGIGHAPFLEDPARFNRELAAFVRGVQP